MRTILIKLLINWYKACREFYSVSCFQKSAACNTNTISVNREDKTSNTGPLKIEDLDFKDVFSIAYKDYRLVFDRLNSKHLHEYTKYRETTTPTRLVGLQGSQNTNDLKAVRLGKTFHQQA